MTIHGEFNWHELQTNEPEKAMAFYRETIGWSFHPEEMPTGDTYWIARTPRGPVAGVLGLHEISTGEHYDRWVIFIHIDDIDGAIAQAESKGAAILQEPWDVPGVGRVAMLREPGGAEVGWVTPLLHDSEA